MSTGKIILVGAGPGDSGLLTLRGRQAIRSAQVVLADRLVGADILAMIPSTAEIIDVGKESGNHTVPQHRINRLLVEKAAQGKQVVRLKGGDPYLFGRGAEELEEAVAAGIPFEVVPGVTSALAVPAYGGIPVTHRDHSSSVHIMTGHAKAGSEPDIAYAALVKAGGTLVFLMGFSAMEEILSGLLEAGMPADTPAALIREGTRPTQKKVTATISTLPQAAREAGMSAPAVLLVGAVCALNEKLDWFSAQSLLGKTVLVTRPHSAGSELADGLEARGCSVIRFPCIRLDAREGEQPPEDLSRYGWIAFTSAFGVETFFDCLLERRQDVRSLSGLKFAAIGSRTARELEARGILADYVPEVYDAAHLARGLVERVPEQERVLLYRARAGTDELPGILGAEGISFDDVPAYDTRYESPAASAVREKLLRGEIHCVTFTSMSTVEGFVGAVGADVVKQSGVTGICIGARTARAAEAHGIPVRISGEATLESMTDAILTHLKEGPA